MESATMKSPLPRRELLRRHWLDIIANLLVAAFVWSEPRFRSISFLSKGSSPRFSLANLSVTGHSPYQPVLPVRPHLSQRLGALPVWYRVLWQHWRPYLSSLPSLPSRQGKLDGTRLRASAPERVLRVYGTIGHQSGRLARIEMSSKKWNGKAQAHSLLNPLARFLPLGVSSLGKWCLRAWCHFPSECFCNCRHGQSQAEHLHCPPPPVPIAL